jgi:hypothetical protein
MCRKFAKAVGELWRTIGDAFDAYRPELHYMRGPGPKWNAKHSGMVIVIATGAGSTRFGSKSSRS